LEKVLPTKFEGKKLYQFINKKLYQILIIIIK
jgi:hypothetical protein